MAPPQPFYILRGHATSITALLFFAENTRLISADAEGWVVIWSLLTKRAVAVWRAHDEGVLGIGLWEESDDMGGERIISHGRDSTLCIWHLPHPDDLTLSTRLPVDDPSTPRKHPWLRHRLTVNSLNFCAFASCTGRVGIAGPRKTEENGEEPTWDDSDGGGGEEANRSGSSGDRRGEEKKETSLFLALPGPSNDGDIEVRTLPSERTIGLIPSPDQANGKTGMVMSLRIFFRSSSVPPRHPTAATTVTPSTDTETTQAQNISNSEPALMVLAGYESGRLYVFRHSPGTGAWEVLYTHLAHTQPLLSLAMSPALDAFYSSGADSIITRHVFPSLDTTTTPTSTPTPTTNSTENTSTSPISSSTKTTTGTPLPPTNTTTTPTTSAPTTTAHPQPQIPNTHPPKIHPSTPTPTPTPTPTQPPQIHHTTTKTTKHSGQQSLTVRSDGKLLATAGWDGRGRVYEAGPGLRELAVLKWHKEGCFAVAFAGIFVGDGGGGGRSGGGGGGGESKEGGREGGGESVGSGKDPVVSVSGSESGSGSRSAIDRPTAIQARGRKVRETHYIALGSKDGKVSLWDIY